MIISDLTHFEEVVAEALNIVGGETSTVAKVLGKDGIQDLKDLELPGLGKLLGTKVNVNIASNGSSTAKTATGTTPEGEKVKISSSSSSVKQE